MPPISFQICKPSQPLAPFVESFWRLENRSDQDKEVIILPDGRIDLIFSQSAAEPFHITLSGIETHAEEAILKANTQITSISFKLPAVEYLFQNSISDLLNFAALLPADFWGFHASDLEDFDRFCEKAIQKIQSLLPLEIDSRKEQLFELIYATNGSISIKELSEKVFWSSRQINRYFNQQFGLSVKAYCNILRFRASFQDIKEGRLFPREDFSDQSHFIREVRKLSGVSPKELKRNQNGRFIQFSAITGK